MGNVLYSAPWHIHTLRLGIWKRCWKGLRRLCKWQIIWEPIVGSESSMNLFGVLGFCDESRSGGGTCISWQCPPTSVAVMFQSLLSGLRFRFDAYPKCFSFYLNMLSSGDLLLWVLSPSAVGYWSGMGWAHTHNINSSYLFTRFATRFNLELLTTQPLPQRDTCLV